ncbi:hypothetical protein [Niallia sp. FSL R7-0271]|uniref:hypothetical protein n=1 Tax=Niallia sp. FSL R7-0271 TaxID=2921678 RepID=UPI0030F80110
MQPSKLNEEQSKTKDQEKLLIEIKDSLNNIDDSLQEYNNNKNSTEKDISNSIDELKIMFEKIIAN